MNTPPVPQGPKVTAGPLVKRLIHPQPKPQPSVEVVRREVAEDPQRRELLKEATAELLTATEGFIERYVSLGDGHQADVLALWVLHCWALDAADATPYIIVRSEEPGCGKTRLLETLSYLVPRPWHTAGATAPTLFRKIVEQPTLLLDETDATFSSRQEGLRAALDAGNRRGSTVTRCEGRTGVKDWPTFCPKVLAGLGDLPDTITDRSITITMSKRDGVAVQRLRPNIAQQEAAPLAHTLAVWAGVAVVELAQLEPTLPEELSDRAADAWEPLLAIADWAGAEWTGRAQAAALELGAGAPAPALTGLEDLSALMPGMAGLMGEVG